MYLVQVALSNYYTSLAKGKALMDDSAFLTSLGLDNIVSCKESPLFNQAQQPARIPKYRVEHSFGAC